MGHGKMKEIKSKEIRSKKNHIVVVANVAGKKEEKTIETAIKKAVRAIRKSSDSGATYELYINSQKSNHREG